MSGAIATLRERKLSYHLLIAPDGDVVKGAPLSDEAWHSGASFGPDGEGVNRYSIGICLIGPNDGSPYSDAQYLTLNRMLAEIAANEPSVVWVTTHWALTVRPDGTARKTDPRALEVSRVRTGRLRWWHPSHVKGAVLP